ncbi:MAG TPA: UDP-glucose/GDP-mannose dehydrogenase family protein [Actinomycetota bacterium]|nr:UDP-glucose/GDP-mannose dehydrogenase family protein [Actinomycetota bacterium]
MNVGIVGTGHVGLPTAAALAHLGHTVTATDADRERIEGLARGSSPFFEPGLDELVERGVAAGRLSFTADPAEAISRAEVVFLCVGTPPTATGEANLSAIERAAEVVARHAGGTVVVVEKSTVPAGTAERVAQTLARHRPDASFFVASNPEFLREGSAVEDSLHPARILVGSDSPEALDTLRRLYRPLVDDGARWIETDLRTAELAKHACNAFLATKVSFANALARISEAAGADVVAVTEIMGADPRIGPAHLSAGLGYGGYCFPKDLQAFERLSSGLGYDFPLLREVARINDEAVEAAFSKVRDALWNLDGKRVALLGLAFKPGTDDVRFAPALALARRLVVAGATVIGYDPQAGTSAKVEAPEVEVVPDPMAALDGAHCAVVCTEWDEVRALDPARIRRAMAFPIVVDGRNVFDPDRMAAAGITYLPTGRRPVRP